MGDWGMKKSVYDYFQNLEKEKLSTSRGILLYDDKTIKYPDNISWDEREFSQNTLVEVLKKPYYMKNFYTTLSYVDMASSQMYNDLGLICPPVHMLSVPNKNNTQIITQDVGSVEGIEVAIASNSIVEEEVFSFEKEINNKWDTLYNKRIKNELLEYMTKECFDQLITMHILDEIRSEADRHLGNYFFYKHIGKEKFEGVIPIDNEFARVVFDGVCTQDDFEKFLKSEYTTPTPLMSHDKISYAERMKNLKNVINSGALSKEQIDIIKRAVNYDLPGAIKNQPRNSFLKKHQKDAYDGISRLWEYHHRNDGIEKEL